MIYIKANKDKDCDINSNLGGSNNHYLKRLIADIDNDWSFKEIFYINGMRFKTLRNDI